MFLSVYYICCLYFLLLERRPYVGDVVCGLATQSTLVTRATCLLCRCPFCGLYELLGLATVSVLVDRAGFCPVCYEAVPYVLAASLLELDVGFLHGCLEGLVGQGQCWFIEGWCWVLGTNIEAFPKMMLACISVMVEQSPPNGCCCHFLLHLPFASLGGSSRLASGSHLGSLLPLLWDLEHVEILCAPFKSRGSVPTYVPQLTQCSQT